MSSTSYTPSGPNATLSASGASPQSGRQDTATSSASSPVLVQTPPSPSQAADLAGSPVVTASTAGRPAASPPSAPRAPRDTATRAAPNTRRGPEDDFDPETGVHRIWHDFDNDGVIDFEGYPGMERRFRRYRPGDPDYYTLEGRAPIRTAYGTFWM